jgi:hypothetical protein
LSQLSEAEIRAAKKIEVRFEVGSDAKFDPQLGNFH